MRVENKADGFAEYRTVDGDLVDSIAFRFYGTHEGTTESLYEDNPHLVPLPMILPAGLVVRLRPMVIKQLAGGQIELWS